ncbi:hypothetical protein [Sphingomonas carotinifaciens]|uniref:hypothetical protein n=1 Tax=Sphingomonas carotinifaciens TaxID=1166323 RepID=UPI001C499557|nr:hypothetical protein [Sphingomonas carotinifaciens]
MRVVEGHAAGSTVPRSGRRSDIATLAIEFEGVWRNLLGMDEVENAVESLLDQHERLAEAEEPERGHERKDLGLAEGEYAAARHQISSFIRVYVFDWLKAEPTLLFYS